MHLAHERRGSGPPLVLLHPLGADRHVWDPVLGRLAAEREVLAVDVPGFGDSPPLRGPATPVALAAAIGSFLDEQGVERPHVAGNSHGGWLALELALAGRARSVTAIAPAGLWSAPLGPRRGGARRVARIASPLLGPLLASPRGRMLVLSSSVAHPDRIPPADAVHLVRSYGHAPGMQATNDAMRAGRFANLADITVPVTLAWPDRDRIVSRPSALPANVHNVVLHDCGHIPMWDDPEQVADLLLRGSAA